MMKGQWELDQKVLQPDDIAGVRVLWRYVSTNKMECDVGYQDGQVDANDWKYKFCIPQAPDASSFDAGQYVVTFQNNIDAIILSRSIYKNELDVVQNSCWVQFPFASKMYQERATPMRYNLGYRDLPLPKACPLPQNVYCIEGACYYVGFDMYKSTTDICYIPNNDILQKILKSSAAAPDDIITKVAFFEGTKYPAGNPPTCQ